MKNEIISKLVKASGVSAGDLPCGEIYIAAVENKTSGNVAVFYNDFLLQKKID